MSSYLETDFCQPDDGLDYIFVMMGAIYGASFNRHWDGMDLGVVRQVWKEKLGSFLTYKPSLDYALSRLDGNFPPSAITFRDLCNAGPSIPSKPVLMIERQFTQEELDQQEQARQKGIQMLKDLKARIKK